MSGFAAIFRFDGAPTGPAALARMVEAIAYRGPDGHGQWAGEGIAMAHLMLHTTAESFEAAQPLTNEDESLVLVMDGWLANNEELRTDLLARGVVLRTRADAELVLRAYETWGDDCPKHIDGEYAFVMWDARRREAFCAKDHAGLRPLHYHWDGKRLLVASDLAGVLAAGDFQHRPNLGMVAEHIANEWRSMDETLWEGVTRLLPAHAMRTGSAGPKLSHYWQPNFEISIRHARDEDYRAHYLELLTDSVRRASRTHVPLACEVSGGLDSSAIFAIAHSQLSQGRLLAPDIKGYTLLFQRGGAEDEVEYARSVGAHLGVTIEEIPAFQPDLAWFVERGQLDRDIPLYPNGAMSETIAQALTADGCKVALNGIGGDEFTTGSPLRHAEAILEHDWSGLMEGLRADHAAFGTRETIWRLYRYGLGPALPLSLRMARRKFSRPSQAGGDLDLCWLAPGLKRTLQERRRNQTLSERLEIPSPTRRAMFMNFYEGFLTYRHDVAARQAARSGFEFRSPMFARSLIEFAFAIPERQRIAGAVRKRIHARSVADLLPAKVSGRTTKAVFETVYDRLLDSAENFVIDAMLQCGIEGDRAPGFARLFHYYRSAAKGHKPLWEVWGLLGCASLFGADALGNRGV